MSICLTAGEQSENHVGMQINGNGLSLEGFSNKDLEKIHKKNGGEIHYFILPNIEEISGCIIIFRNGLKKIFDIDPDKMLEEQLGLKWDEKYWDTRRGKVLSKRARFNLCYGEKEQHPEYQNKKGTIIPYEKVPLLKKWKTKLIDVFGKKAECLEIEGNYYYNPKKCGIGFHGDSERKKVIACSLGESRPIVWQWYYQTKPIEDHRYEFILNHGDIYIMSEKATGWDWKKRKIPTLRHAAGEKYIK